jgi:protein-tyrosine phosphatase
MMYDYARLQVPGAPHPLFISARPGFGIGGGAAEIREFTEHFTEQEVRTVMVLMTAPELSAVYGEGLLRAYRRTGFQVLHCPIEDFSVPADMQAFSECIEELWKALHHGAALMHCAAGLGRSGLTAASLLVRSGLDWETALERVREVRPGAAQTRQQEEFVARYSRHLSRGRA